MWVSALTTKSTTTDMSPTSHKPLLIALIIASSLSLSFGLLLYLNEDLRTSTFVLLEKVVNEEGEEEVRIKVEKPEPNREQIREIARNKERKKEESLKEKAKDIRKSLVRIEEATDSLKKELNAGVQWNALFRLIQEIERSADLAAGKFASSKDLEFYQSLPQEFETIHSLIKKSRIMIAGYLDEEPEGIEAFFLLGDSFEIEGRLDSMNGSIRRKRESIHKKDGKWTLSDSRNRIRDLEDLAEDYVSELKQALYGMVPLEEETLADLMESELPEPLDGSLAEQLPAEEEFDAMDIAELYESIQNMTALGDEIFAENRAAELSATEQIAMQEAREQVYAPQSDTGPDLQQALQQRDPSNMQQYQEYSEALNRAERSAANMARHAANRQQQAAPEDSQGNDAQTAQQLQEALSRRAGAMAQMSAMASNQGRERGNLQDMRGLMMQAYQLNSGNQGGGAAGDDGKILSQTYGSDLNVLGGGQLRGSSAPISLNLNRVMRQAIPGRRLTTDSPRKGWIFLDTWYVIGPWDRPRQNSFDTRFPPEVEVNLDAEYMGKDHPGTKQPLQLKWNFVQTDNIRINPPDEIGDAVYYAYTEVFAERAMEVVVAVASDDIAKMWINDLVVWEDEGLSAWRIDEGFRRILLKPGYNKVLVRVENGPAVCYFSVLFSPVDGLNL